MFTQSLTHNFRVGQKVVFGRERGEQTRGTIVKINRLKLKVRQDEPRGTRPIGTVWGVPPSLVCAVDGAPVEKVAPPVQPVAPITDYWLRENQCALQITAHVYCMLSPEAATCDGERPMSEVRRWCAAWNRKLEACFVLLERRIDESACYKLLDRANKLMKKGN
jgi:hypothetical protein